MSAAQVRNVDGPSPHCGTQTHRLWRLLLPATSGAYCCWCYRCNICCCPAVALQATPSRYVPWLMLPLLSKPHSSCCVAVAAKSASSCCSLWISYSQPLLAKLACSARRHSSSTSRHSSSRHRRSYSGSKHSGSSKHKPWTLLPSSTFLSLGLLVLSRSPWWGCWLNAGGTSLHGDTPQPHTDAEKLFVHFGGGCPIFLSRRQKRHTHTNTYTHNGQLLALSRTLEMTTCSCLPPHPPCPLSLPTGLPSCCCLPPLYLRPSPRCPLMVQQPT